MPHMCSICAVIELTRVGIVHPWWKIDTPKSHPQPPSREIVWVFLVGLVVLLIYTNNNPKNKYFWNRHRTRDDVYSFWRPPPLTTHITSCINPLTKVSARTAPIKNEKGRLNWLQWLSKYLNRMWKDIVTKIDLKPGSFYQKVFQFNNKIEDFMIIFKLA